MSRALDRASGISYTEGEPDLAGKPTIVAITIKNKESAGGPLGLRRASGGDTTDLVMRIIENAKLNPMSDEKLAAENTGLMAYGARRAKKAGIKEGDIPRVIHATRAQQQTS